MFGGPKKGRLLNSGQFVPKQGKRTGKSLIAASLQNLPTFADIFTILILKTTEIPGKKGVKLIFNPFFSKNSQKSWHTNRRRHFKSTY